MLYFFMIKNVMLATMLMATAPLNVIVPQSHKDTQYISTYGNVIGTETRDNNDNITEGRYYTIKLFSSEFNLTKATMDAKGFQYTYYNLANEQAYQIIDYYFRYEYAIDTYLTYVQQELYLKGNINPNGYGNVMYFEEYSFNIIYSFPVNTVDNFIDNDTYDLQTLDTLRNQAWGTLPNDDIDIIDTYATLTTDNEQAHKPKYLRFRIKYAMDYDNIEDVNPTTMMQTTQNIYTSLTATYTFSYDVEYTQEIVDIPGLLFQILGMPFAWFSTAFNLTIFPGTPYAVNISHIIMAVIGALILIVILKKVIK